MSEVEDRYMTTAEAGKRLLITEGAVRHAIRRGTIKGVRFGGRWLVELGDMQPGDRKNGRPYSEKTRCPCGEHTLRRAVARNFDCCRKAGVTQRKMALAKNRLEEEGVEEEGVADEVPAA